MHTMLGDLRFAMRLMWKSPGFSVAVVLTLAIAIGATTAIWTLVDASLVRGLPYPEPARLVQVTMTKADHALDMEASYPTFLDWQEQSASFEFLAGYAGNGGVARFGTGNPRLISRAVVTADFFRVLGTTPVLGTDVPSGDEDPADKHRAMLSHGLWMREFGGSPGAIGTTFVFDGTSYVVAGVLPAGFEFAPLGEPEFFTPVQRLPFQMRRNLHWLNVVGRLAPGVTLDQAESELVAISARLGQQYPDSNKDTSARIVPLREAILGDIQPVMLLLLLGVATLLLIACVNVAGLMLARSANRQKEMAIRLALGAQRGRLVRQSLTEALVLSLAGALAGLLVAEWALGALVAAIPEALLRFMPYLQHVEIDGRALAFTGGLALLTAILFGLAPAFQATRPRPQDVLGDDVRTTAGATTSRLRSVLVSAQVALAVVLLAGAFLTSRSLLAMLDQDPGFETDGLAALRILLPGERYPDGASRVPALIEIRHRLSGLPGVSGAALADRAPLQAGNTVRFRDEHDGALSAGEQSEATIRSIDAAYIQVLQARLLRGRLFDAREEADGPPVLLVNRTLAEQEFPGQDPVGRRIVFTFAPDQPAREIVGVIDDVREGPLDAAPQPALYLPLLRGGPSVVDIVLRTDGEPSALLAPAEHVLTAFDPAVVLMRRTTFDALVGDAPWVFIRQYPATLTSSFAAVALLLAGLGIFGTISYLTALRTREIGVRIALGARPVDVLRLMMGHGLLPVAAGTAAGVVSALALARLAGSLLFGVSPADPLTFLSVTLIVAVTAAMAAYFPARRAMCLDPVAALQRQG